MGTLPGPWQPMRGISCAGWDIVLAKDDVGCIAIWSRRISHSVDTPYDLRGRYRSEGAGVKAIEDIETLLQRGEYDADFLFPDEPLKRHFQDHPMFGVF